MIPVVSLRGIIAPRRSVYGSSHGVLAHISYSSFIFLDALLMIFLWLLELVYVAIVCL